MSFPAQFQGVQLFCLGLLDSNPGKDRHVKSDPQGRLDRSAPLDPTPEHGTGVPKLAV